MLQLALLANFSGEVTSGTWHCQAQARQESLKIKINFLDVKVQHA